MLLVLKLILVPSLLYALAQSGQWWGQHIAGRLAALPWVAGPILAILALEQGEHFAAQAATMSVASVTASEAFNLGYARSSSHGWQLATLAGVLLWSATATLLPGIGPHLGLAIFVALLASYLNSRLLPAFDTRPAPASKRQGSMSLRLLAGASLTLLTSHIAAHAGPQWRRHLRCVPDPGLPAGHRDSSLSEPQCRQRAAAWHVSGAALLHYLLRRTGLVPGTHGHLAQLPACHAGLPG